MKIKSGSTNVSVYYYVVQDASGTSPGEPVTGLLFSDIETSGSASYVRQGAARVDLTLITLASASAAHADGGFILVDDTNMPGLYRCDYPDSAFVTGVDQIFCSIVVASANNAVAAPILVDIDDNVDQTVDNNVLAAGATGFAAIDTVVDLILEDTADIQPKVAKIPLSDGTITFNSTALASINAECDTALADYDGPTNTEMIARTRLDDDYFSWATDDVAVVTLVNTLTTYTGNTPQTADHTAAIADIPTVSEFNARTLVAANYFDPATDAVANVTLVATTTTNTDMIGTANALLAASYTAPDNVGITQTQTDIAALNNITVAQILAGGDIDGFTLEESQKLILAASVGVLAGAATNSITIKAADGSKTRITATVDSDGNRSVVIKDVTG